MTIKTYQDLLAVGQDEARRTEFILSAIADHKSSDLYKTAVDAELYYRHMNPTIMHLQKVIFNAAGKAVSDIWAANNKVPSRMYFYFIVQSVQFLLGNGVSFRGEETKQKLGKDFDRNLCRLAIYAMNGGVAYGFWNFEKLEIFPVGAVGSEPVFIPLVDEENGALRAGIRYWQIASNKPLRCTLYEEDGYTDYIREKGKEMSVMTPKRDYIQIERRSEATGTEIFNGGNYPGFPIIPLFNVNHQSEIVGNRNTLDAYDLMASALVNNVDDGNLIYWVLKNCGGMDAEDDERFIEQLKLTHVVHADGDGEGASVDAHTVEAPFQANEAALERLRSQLFDDFMALDVKNIAGGAATATQIKAAYEPLNSKADLFEGQVTEFIESLLELIGIDDTPTYTRSLIVNQQEQIQNLVTANEYLSREYITRKILEILGDTDKAEEVIGQLLAEEVERFGGVDDDESGDGTSKEEES